MTAPNNTRIRLDKIEFLTAGSEFLAIGDGHNASDDDSMITKIEGVRQSLSMVTSGNMLWIKYFGDVKKTGQANMTIMFYLQDETGEFSILFYFIIYGDGIVCVSGGCFFVRLFVCLYLILSDMFCFKYFIIGTTDSRK